MEKINIFGALSIIMKGKKPVSQRKAASWLDLSHVVPSYML